MIDFVAEKKTSVTNFKEKMSWKGAKLKKLTKEYWYFNFL